MLPNAPLPDNSAEQATQIPNIIATMIPAAIGVFSFK
jgi:hypothetical protein